ncbi:TraR/DksA family transcriptional regulator [Halopseudomonas salina]|uniref:Molecular chaperone DnaK n=1 Tax=Halopseudomonas salina TaxID=1323744 RepID=A0ABQ1PN62_9GAMM|nr:TraR/DksA family transcriptional regulator [Halopseudomonas salina]GGC99960.1 molecular chaperone DnaK [Halopseudomonas salina]
MDSTLRAELDGLLHRRIAEFEAGCAAGSSRSEAVELDQARVGRLSRMDAMQQQAMLDATKIRNQQELKRLVRALARVESDDFGYCEECGEPIAAGRLRIDPAAHLCVECAAQH